MMQKPGKYLKPCQMGFHLSVLSENYPMNNTMAGLKWFSKTLYACDLDESSLSHGLGLRGRQTVTTTTLSHKGTLGT